MATIRTTTWCTKHQLCCGGPLPLEATVCVPASILASPPATLNGFIAATLTSVRPSTKSDKCGECHYVYTLQYDKDQLAAGYTLRDIYINEVLCGCIPDLIKSGSITPLTTVSVTDTESVDLTLTNVGNNYDIAADVNISADAGNIITIQPDGLFAAPTGGGCCYEEGAVEPVAEGTVVFWKDAGNVLVAVTAATPLPVDATITFPSTATASEGIVSVNNTAGGTAIVAANALRIGGEVRVSIDAPQSVRLERGATASATSRLYAPGDYLSLEKYTGPVTGFVASGTADVEFTEL